MRIDFDPIGRLTAKKQYHYICIALAIIIPVVLIIVTLVKKTFTPFTLAVGAVAAAVMLIIDYSNRSNMVVYNEEKIALLSMLGKPEVYTWDKLSAVQSSDTTMRLDFSDGKKLYINLEYDGIDEFKQMLKHASQKLRQ